jgi:glycosyltransferase involved in cell wall biosynthesis
VILGGGSLLTNMQKLVDDLKINDNVRFIDRVPKTDMPHWYAACDIFLDTCVFGQGYATLEALASGKPAIGFDVGQIKIEDGKDGFLVERNDVHEIAEKITWLIENPNERQKMGIYGRKRVEKCCSLKNRVREIKQIYEKVLSAQN